MQQSDKTFLGKGGFTLIEMVVSTAIFLIAILIIVGALVSLSDAARKARAIRTVTDNLSAAVESMNRNIRMGTNFHCGCVGATDVPLDCPMTDALGNGGDVCLAIEAPGGDPQNPYDQVIYRLNANTIERSTDGGTTFLALTAPEITINKFRFYVSGTTVQQDQPYVTIVLNATAGINKVVTPFNIQTTVAERTPNFDLSTP